MKNTEKQTTESPAEYKAPELEIVSLRGDEVLAGSCKDISGAGPFAACSNTFGTPCSSLGS